MEPIEYPYPNCLRSKYKTKIKSTLPFSKCVHNIQNPKFSLTSSKCVCIQYPKFSKLPCSKPISGDSQQDYCNTSSLYRYNFFFANCSTRYQHFVHKFCQYQIVLKPIHFQHPTYVTISPYFFHYFERPNPNPN